MTNESIVLWFQQNFVTIIQAIVGVIIAYLAYRINRGRLKIEKYIEISEKVGLTIKPNQNETIVLSNSGIYPVDELVAKLDITISRKKSPDIPLHLEWERKTVLNPKEDEIILLYEKLAPVLVENKLMRPIEFDIPTGRDFDEEFIMEKESVRHLLKTLSATINIEVKSKVHDLIRTTKKTFRLDYYWKPEFYSEPPYRFDYEDNFSIQITELMGNWKS